jgi:ferric-dicitrate binding protein FerR (iron transport regulator)
MVHDIPWMLLEKHFANETSTSESQQINEWLGSASENAMILEQLQSYYQTYGSLPLEFLPDTKAALENVSEKTTPCPKIFRMYSWWWKVAAVVLIGFCSWWLIHEPAIKQTTEFSTVLKSDTTVTTITLSDGSHIWLNAHSSIKYPEKFDNTREVFLEGEAYFEIAHDSADPFIVRTSNTQTRVLGTKFDIRSYPSENHTTLTVAEGKVSFGNAANKQVVLTVNQKGTFDKTSGDVSEVENDNCNFMSWKTLDFNFDGQPLEIVFKTLSEVYHFNYQFDSSSLKTRILTASFRHRPLNEIIQTISLSANAQITLQNGKYSIKQSEKQ